jgi:crotonobetainyl-CoA:carnitine CoA-transferase CaiB-like acyl-CoA transferase
MQVGDDERPQSGRRLACGAVNGPLEGLLVADFSRVLAGPYAAMLLGDLGADVIKVERPGTGDDTRAWGPPWRDGEATYYLGLNRNKRSVALDLGDPDDRELARELAMRADVLLESFRPGLMAEWGLDGETLRASGNPGLVSCSVSAFGTGEAARALPGYDFLLQAMGGLMHITGEEHGEPVKVGSAVVDLVCGLLCATGTLAALRERDMTGAGRHVEVSLMDSVLTTLLNQGSAWVLGGERPHRRGNRHPSIAPYETYATADRPIAVAVGNDRLFARLCAALGRPELPADERFATNSARVANVDALGAEIESVLRTRPAAEWIDVLRAASVPVGPINDVAEAWALADSLGLDPVDAATGVPAPPLRLSGERPDVRLPPPALDEHGDEIRSWLRRAPGGSSSGA